MQYYISFKCQQSDSIFLYTVKWLPWSKPDWQPSPYVFIYLFFLIVNFRASHVALVVEYSSANAGERRDVGWSWLRNTLGGKHDNPLQYSCLENPTDRATWQAMDHRVAKCRTQLKRHNMPRNFKIFYLSNFQIYNTALCTIYSHRSVHHILVT